MLKNSATPQIDGNCETYHFDFYRVLRGYQRGTRDLVDKAIGGQLFPIGETDHTAHILVNTELRFYYAFTGAWYCGQGINQFVEVYGGR
jgi:hypothetical protein